MIDSVVDLSEEHVDLGGSQFSESIVERWYFARISQWKVRVLELLKSMSVFILSRSVSSSMLSVPVSFKT